MKEATGELNMTVITVVAIGAIAALFYVFIWPMIQRTIVQQTCNTFGTTADGSAYKAVKVKDSTTGVSDKTSNWECCPAGKTAGDASCIAAD